MEDIIVPVVAPIPIALESRTDNCVERVSRECSSPPRPSPHLSPPPIPVPPSPSTGYARGAPRPLHVHSDSPPPIVSSSAVDKQPTATAALGFPAGQALGQELTSSVLPPSTLSSHSASHSSSRGPLHAASLPFNMKEMLGGCCVCSDENGWTGNPLVYCDGPECEVAVHQGCYGILEVPEGEWLCAKCSTVSGMNGGGPMSNGNGVKCLETSSPLRNGSSSAFHPRCELCPFGYGALKRTDKGAWAHVICALYIPEVRFGDVHSMDPVILEDVPADRFERTCYLCEDEGALKDARVGACMNCNRSGCKKSFHVTCAQRRGLLCEEGGVSKNVKYCGYCAHHLKKASADPSIKIVPPCKVRPLGASAYRNVPKGNDAKVKYPSTFHYASSSAASTPKREDKMMVEPIPRPEAVLGSAAGTDALLQSGGSTTFSPPLTSSSRSSLAQEGSSPPLKESSLHLNGHGPSSSLPGPSSTVLPPAPTPPSGILVGPVPTVSPSEAAVSTPSSLYNGNGTLGLSTPSTSAGLPLTNHNRLDGSSSTATRVNGRASRGPTPPLPNHHNHPNVHPSVSGSLPVGAAIAAGLVTPKAGGGAVASSKRKGGGELEGSGSGGKGSKRPRQSHHAKGSSVRELLDAVEPLVSETVSDFQRERVADKAAAAERSRLAALTGEGYTVGGGGGQRGLLSSASVHGINDVKPSLHMTPSTSLGLPSDSLNPSGTGPAGVPATMEELLERQWEQGSNFVMSNSHFDVAQLLSCLLQLKKENGRLEGQLSQLVKRRDHLLALNARLSMPLGATAAHAANATAPLPPTHASLPATAHQNGIVSNGGLVSPHAAASPHLAGIPAVPPVTTASSEDSLSQLRSLAAGAVRSATPLSQAPPRGAASGSAPSSARPPAVVPSTTAADRFAAPAAPSASAYASRPATTLAGMGGVTAASTTTSFPSIPTTSTAATGAPDLEQIARALANSPFMANPANRQQVLGGGNGMDPLISLLLQQQHQQQASSFLNSHNNAALLRMFMGAASGTAAAPAGK